jgi:hypothetical protein
MFNGLRSEVCSGFGMARPEGWKYEQAGIHGSISRLGYMDLRTNPAVKKNRDRPGGASKG